MRKVKTNDEEILTLYKQGLSDSRIAIRYGCHSQTIANRRKVLGLPSNQGITIEGVHRKQTSIKLEILKPLVESGLSDYKIAKIIGYNNQTVRNARKFYKLERGYLHIAKSVQYTQRQLEILIGHVLGDGHLRKDYTNVTGRISQGIAQLEYTKWKVAELSPLCGEMKINTRMTADDRTGIYYTSADSSIHANPELNWIYDMFYWRGYKELDESMVPHITALTVAVWFMDDGNISPFGYCIATQSFKRHDVLRSIFNKFGIIIRIHKSGTLYVPSRSKKQFEDLISVHIISSMRYKLHTVVT